MKPINYSWFLFILLKYSYCFPEQVGNVPPQFTPSYSRTGRSLEKVALASAEEKNSWKYLFHRSAIGILGAANKYCRNTYDPKEVETLLDIDMDAHILSDNWWRRKTRDSIFPIKINNPMCSHIPSATTLTAISMHEFFQRQIYIPIQLGAIKIGLIKYIFSIKEAAQKLIMECDCDIIATSPHSEALCSAGKIYFSRGTGGDKSFFLHVPNSDGTFKVIAHLCFR